MTTGTRVVLAAYTLAWVVAVVVTIWLPAKG